MLAEGRCGQVKSMKLPVGIDSFEKLRREDFYYVDKTGLIRDLLGNWGKVNLFTRPRRFGKTLNMSMLKSFFEIGADGALFEGLAISKENALCEAYMGKFPVVFISLKGVEGLTFEQAMKRFKEIIGLEAERFAFLRTSEKLSENDKEKYSALIALQDGQYSMDMSMLISSLQTLSRLLCKHHGQKAMLLIDEYDVPLDKAYHHGYYSEMVSLLRGLFGQALKTNDSLYFAVMTGCLRVSKESIFTGLNNMKVHSIADVKYDEYFGFTDEEVGRMLADYGLEEWHDIVRAWYDGYRFGNADVYCPWDVVNFAKKLIADPSAQPQAFWINTSSNELVKDFVEDADKTTQGEIERLIAGETIEKDVRLELTYAEVRKSIDNLWSVLFTTGYLTHAGKTREGAYKLKIPNREVREVFIRQIQEWFRESLERDRQPMQAFCRAFLNGEAEEIRRQLTVIMGRMISILDTKAREEQKENFYHGLLLGLLRSEPSWLILSNAESGEGFSDILIEPEDPDAGIVIEVKYAASIAGLGEACERAMAQIKERRYDERLRSDGRENILAYGIAFCKKRCGVVCEKLDNA